MSFRSEREAYRRESPGPINYGFFLNISWFYSTEEIGELISRWQEKVEACTNETARAEWLDRIKKLRAFLREQ
ncbi:hypothetical protein [Streptomyces sp. V3I7]|uniref:hypothetical protein n=1 Tax=Streptomyces sp. V3I7 TaxID=3042278 RepID=UPI0027824A7E|nr:hypothetical protein [Streptomyces sp. V3I7]MDQ0993043.1 hypothetical protein [Streptomyces sp. V3I7]